MTVVAAELGGAPDVLVIVDRGTLRYAASLGEAGRRIDVALPFAHASIATLLLSFLGDASAPDRRRAIIDDVRHAVRDGGTLVVVDHNRPRRRPSALAALLRSPSVPGATPSARWRRTAAPVGHELQRCGAGVARLRLAAGERVQLVVAMMPQSPASA